MKRQLVVGLTACLLLLAGPGCGTDTGNPSAPQARNVGLTFASYNASLSTKITTQAVSGWEVCVRYMLLKEDLNGSDDVAESVNIYEGRLQISPSGTVVADIDIPHGTYQRIDVELKKEYCSPQFSMTITNDNGTFTTDEDIKMRFDGLVVIDENTTELELDFGAIVGAVNSATQNSELRDNVEAVSGDF